MSDIVGLRVLEVRGNTVRVQASAFQAAGAFMPATPSFALGMLSELQPQDWDRTTLGGTWHQDQARILRLAQEAIRSIRVVAGEHFGEGGNGLDHERRPTLRFDIEVADATWLGSLEVGAYAGSALYPQPLRRAKWSLVSTPRAASECLATLRAWCPKTQEGGVPTLDDAQWETLGEWLFHPSDGVPKAVMALLPTLGSRARSLLRRVAELTCDWENETRVQAMACLAELGDPRAADVLLTLTVAEWPRDVYAIRALGRLPTRSPEVVSLLETLAPTVETRETLAWALWRSTGSEERLSAWLNETFPSGRHLYLLEYTPTAEVPAMVERLCARIKAAPEAMLKAEAQIRSLAKGFGAAGKPMMQALKSLSKKQGGR
jgi:hypothetical protein